MQPNVTGFPFPPERYSKPMNLLLVALGSGLGAATRALMPGPLLVLNLIGCLAFGMLKPSAFWRTGFLGGFTSFSGYIMLADAHSATSSWGGLGEHLLLPALGCVVAVFIGSALRKAGQRWLV